MKTLSFSLSLIFLCLAFNSFSQRDNVVGIYLTPKKDGKIAIYKNGNSFHGKLIWGIQNLTDVKNPNPSLRSRKMIGTDFMTGFTYNDGEYINGKIYDPTSGKTYDCKMWLDGNKLKVRGYLGISAFGRTETFTRAG